MKNSKDSRKLRKSNDNHIGVNVHNTFHHNQHNITKVGNYDHQHTYSHHHHHHYKNRPSHSQPHTNTNAYHNHNHNRT